MESVGYTLKFGEHKVACCTDLGYVTDEVRDNLLGSDTVYFRGKLRSCAVKGKSEISAVSQNEDLGDHGHLSNGCSAEFCKELVAKGASRLILGHLSQENNSPKMAYELWRKR